MTTEELKEWAQFAVDNKTTMVAVGQAILALIAEKKADEIIAQGHEKLISDLLRDCDDYKSRIKALEGALSRIIKSAEGVRLPFKGDLWMAILDARAALAGEGET